MRILNISAQKPDSTGIGTYLSALVRAQLAAGHEPAVLCGAAPGDTQGDIPPGVPVFTVDFETSALPFKSCIKKGVESLVRALGRLSPQAASVVELTLVGGHGDETELESIRRASAQAPCPVEFAGRLPRDELVRAYRSSEVFVLPSFFEGLPLVSIEAIACGCKVVMTDLPGVRLWMEAVLPQAPVTWVAPPAMLDVDTPDPAALPAFERRLARAIEGALAAPTPVCDPSGVSWDACSARILEVARTLKGGCHGTR